MYNVNDEFCKNRSVSVYNVCQDACLGNIHERARRAVARGRAGVQNVQAVVVHFERLVRVPEQKQPRLARPRGTGRFLHCSCARACRKCARRRGRAPARRAGRRRNRSCRARCKTRFRGKVRALPQYRARRRPKRSPRPPFCGAQSSPAYTRDFRENPKKQGVS